MSKVLLCVDIGTSSLKTAFITPEGSVLSYARVGFSGSGVRGEKQAQPVPFDGSLWIIALQKAFSQLRIDSPQAELLGVCISGNGPTLATESGKVLLWNHSIPSHIQEQVFKELAPTLRSSIFIPRLKLFQTVFPRQWQSSSVILSGPEYLIWRLTDTAATILPEQRYTQAYWTEQHLSQADIDKKKLPPFVSPGTMAGGVTQEASTRTGIPQGTPVFCGAPDFIVALIGTNTLHPGAICDRAGSSEGINLCLAINPTEIIQNYGIEGLRILPSVIPDLWNASVLLPSSGSQFSALKRAVAPHMDYPHFVEALLRDPSLDKKSFFYMEDIALKVKDGFEKLSLLAHLTGTPLPTTLCTAGGQAKNPRWLEYKSRVMHIPIETTTCPDSELMGDAILAYTHMGLFSNLQEGAEKLVQTACRYE